MQDLHFIVYVSVFRKVNDDLIQDNENVVVINTLKEILGDAVTVSFLPNHYKHTNNVVNPIDMVAKTILKMINIKTPS